MGQGFGIAMSCGVGHRHGLDLALLWLWCRVVAVALIRALAWEPPYATGAALKKQKQNKTKQNKKPRTVKKIMGEGEGATQIVLGLRGLGRLRPVGYD